MSAYAAPDPDPALRALADRHRRAILRVVRTEPRAVGEIATEVGLSQQATSHHLGVLRAAGLVSSTRAGTRHLFAVNTDGLTAVRSYLDEFWPNKLAALNPRSRPSGVRSMAEHTSSIDIAAAPAEVFEFLVTPQGTTAWMGEHAELEPHSGGLFAVDIAGSPVRGRYLEVDRPNRVVVSWGLAGSSDFPPGTSTVSFTLTAIAAGTRVDVTHSRLPDALVAGHADGWAHFLPRLEIVGRGDDAGIDDWTPLPLGEGGRAQ